MKESEKGPGGPGKKGAERRQASRHPTSMPLKYRCLDDRNVPAELEYRSGRALDVSPIGMCVAVAFPLPVGQNVELSTDEGNDENPMRVIGTVVRIVRRTDYYEAGIAFQKPD